MRRPVGRRAHDQMMRNTTVLSSCGGFVTAQRSTRPSLMRGWNASMSSDFAGGGDTPGLRSPYQLAIPVGDHPRVVVGEAGRTRASLMSESLHAAFTACRTTFVMATSKQQHGYHQHDAEINRTSLDSALTHVRLTALLKQLVAPRVWTSEGIMWPCHCMASLFFP